MPTKRLPHDPPHELTTDEKAAQQQSTEEALSVALDVLEDERKEFNAAIRAIVFERRPDLRGETMPTLNLVRAALA